ncbi:RNA polymerase subunit sigma [Gammaproteobacteria bacterium 42_54_T18]|nr:RNA polymerase subunit sigma [Gammaproteobacteria bacterium 42_54_T18]
MTGSTSQAEGKQLDGASQLNDADYLETLRQQMLKFANLQISDTHLAEDAVQEALIGALKKADSFGGRSAFKTWVFAILKNKIADVLRKRQRLAEVSELMGSDEDDEALSSLFDKRGHWNPEDKPNRWGDPEDSFKQQQFWVVFETCLNNLPGNQAKVFMMREYIGLNTDEICKEVDLSVSNLHVMLHRARLKLQKCLEIKWYDGGKHA